MAFLLRQGSDIDWTITSDAEGIGGPNKFYVWRRAVLNFSVGFLLVITLINFNVQRIRMELFTVLK
jgi:hypothetical protein